MTREELLEKAKPILFNTEMVKAIIDGRKTVTRRVIKPQPKMRLAYVFAGSHDVGKWEYPSSDAYKYWGDEFKWTEDITNEDAKKTWTPPCKADDILYIRETWGEGYEEGTYIYKADDKLLELPEFKNSSKMIYRPSIHMPKVAARIFLKVKSVRVERLQDISSEHIEKEGVETEYPYVLNGMEKRYAFEQLWISTMQKTELEQYGWDANPWVWVIEFERIEVV